MRSQATGWTPAKPGLWQLWQPQTRATSRSIWVTVRPVVKREKEKEKTGEASGLPTDEALLKDSR